MPSKADVARSKFLSLVLRHDPAAAGLRLDEAGWARVEDVLAGAARAGVALDGSTLERIVAESDKKRFTLSEVGGRIRAAQGHSVEIALGLAPVTPPGELFHGTAAGTLAPILAEGLKPMSRQHVHLSPDRETAMRVGSRHGRPVVLLVEAAAMAAEGRLFFQAENGVWLTDHVPAERLSVLSRDD